VAERAPEESAGPLLAELTTLRLGGPAGRYVRATTEGELVEAVRAADDAGEHAETSFTFNVIDAIDQKRTATLAVGNATALIKRLDQLARAQESTKTESWV